MCAIIYDHIDVALGVRGPRTRGAEVRVGKTSVPVAIKVACALRGGRHASITPAGAVPPATGVRVRHGCGRDAGVTFLLFPPPSSVVIVFLGYADSATGSIERGLHASEFCIPHDRSHLN